LFKVHASALYVMCQLVTETRSSTRCCLSYTLLWRNIALSFTDP